MGVIVRQKHYGKGQPWWILSIIRGAECPEKSETKKRQRQ